MKALITSARAQEFNQRVAAEIEACHVSDVPVFAAHPQEVNPYLIGCRMHNLMRRFADRNSLHLKGDDRVLFHCLTAMRTELRRLGAGFIEPEMKLKQTKRINRDGRCDLLLHTRRNFRGFATVCDLGIAEVKVVQETPGRPDCNALLQTAAYCEMAAEAYGCEVWCAVCYLNVRDSVLRVFQFRNTQHLRESAAAVLAA